MKLLFVQHDKKFLDSMIPKLIPLGVELYTADSEKEVQEWILKKENNSIFFNITAETIYWVDFIANLKQDSKYDYLKIAVYLPHDNHRCLRKLYQYGITAFIYHSSIPDHLTTQMLSIIRYLEQEGERRGHVRIETSKKDNVNIEFDYKGTKIKTKVFAISPVALSFSPPNQDLFKITEKKEIIKDIELQIGDDKVSIEAIIARSNHMVALMFVNLKEQFLNILCNFIFKKLNHKEL